MKAEITFSQVLYNPSLLNFFFRSQAERTLVNLIEKVDCTQDALEKIEEYANDNDYDLDAIEEMFYKESVEELAKDFGIEIEEEEEEEYYEEDFRTPDDDLEAESNYAETEYYNY